MSEAALSLNRSGVTPRSLEAALVATYPRDVIAMRNGHLAREQLV
jgi:hypothetical protein